jgi:hypothetical protein
MQIYEEKSAEFLNFAREMRGFESKEVGRFGDFEGVLLWRYRHR